MIAEPKEKKSGGFFAKLKERLNRGKTWLTSDLLGFGGRPFDESTVEELETRLEASRQRARESS